MKQMCITNTPLERHDGLWVKREDLCCPGGPNFSKTRGVFARVAGRNETFIGVLDTSHSQGGWAVARACQIVGKDCVVYYPKFKKDRGWSPSQIEAKRLGARIVPLQAGRSAILYHQAKKDIGEYAAHNYMMPNALKLHESVEETAAEFKRTEMPERVKTIVVSASSGTIAAGVFLGAAQTKWAGEIIVHMGYSRPAKAVTTYLEKMSGVDLGDYKIVDEGYNYADAADPSFTAPFPCNSYYDLKALLWLKRKSKYANRSDVLFWNIG